MSEINWNDAPKDAERYCERFNVFFRKVDGNLEFYSTRKEWVRSHDPLAEKDWENATPRPFESPINWNDAPEGAERYSQSRKYWLKKVDGTVWSYGNDDGLGWMESFNTLNVRDDWKIATPRPPERVSEVDKTVNERGERYGNFIDGAEIMQSLKNVMRESEGWSRLTNSQREGLEMIQHKIGRVLNGDPNYDDNYRDIAGYATLLLDKCNGVNR